MYVDPSSREITKISRPKLVGPGRHFGVVLEDSSRVVVVHLKSTGSIEITTLEGFACGQDVRTEEVLPENQHQTILDRLQQVQRNPRRYHLSNWNCETFANWLAHGKAESSQVMGLVTVALLAAIVAIAQ